MLAPRRPPSVLLLMADQQKATSLRLYGNRDTRTPTIDALAERGAWVEHCIVPHPFCLPSRCALLTGRYPHVTRVRGNSGQLPPREVPLPQILQRSGYRTAAVGHFHKGAGGGRGCDVAMDMSEGRQGAAWRRHDNKVMAAEKRTAHMTATLPGAAREDVDAVMTDDAIDFLESVPGDTPFFLEVAWIAPHPPYFAPAPYDGMYDPSSLGYPRQEGPGAGKPEIYERCMADMGTLDAPVEELRRALAVYYGMVSLLDDQVARLLDALRRRGRLEDTIVIYTSDHGDYAGEHGMWGKSCTLYDCLVRVPLIMAGPNYLLPQGRALEGMVQSIDLLPTLLHLLGMPIPENVQGLPLQPLWGAPAPQPAYVPAAGRTGFDVAFAEVGGFAPSMVLSEKGNNVPAGPPSSGRQVEMSAMARTERWKAIYTPGRGVQELYDLEADPGELQNLSGRQKYAEIESALRQRIMDWPLAQP